MDSVNTAVRISVGVYSALLVACAQPIAENRAHPPMPEISYHMEGVFAERPPIPGVAQIFALTEDQEKDFLNYLNRHKFDAIPRHERVFNYLARSTRNFNFRGETYRASEALIKGEGNCMSLTLLTAAFAHLADIEIRYQLIDSSPVFEQGQEAIAKGLHVRSKLYRNRTLDVNESKAYAVGRPNLVVDYFYDPNDVVRFRGNLTEQEVIARYYRNVAVELLQRQEYSDSYWYVLESFKHDPASDEGINLMAVIFKHLGKLRKAEEIYKYGIASTEDKLSLLKNYRQLLREQGRIAEAQTVSEAIAEYDDPSPYVWLEVADTSFEQGDYAEALTYYKRAIKIAPYLQYGYLGLAKIYIRRGDYTRAEANLLLARERNYTSENEQLYEAKLSALARLK